MPATASPRTPCGSTTSRWRPPWLHGLAGVYLDRLDRWFDEDEEVPAFRDPYHRVDVRRTSRRVEVRAGDEVVAESDRALLLSETGMFNRFYLPREEVTATLDGPTAKTTYCVYKGTACYFTVEVTRAASASRTSRGATPTRPATRPDQPRTICRSGARTSRSSSMARSSPPSDPSRVRSRPLEPVFRERWKAARHAPGACDRWFALLSMTRVLGTVVAVGLLLSHRVTRHDVPLAAVTVAWSATP